MNLNFFFCMSILVLSYYLGIHVKARTLLKYKCKKINNKKQTNKQVMHPITFFFSLVLGRENKNIHNTGVPHSPNRDKYEKAKEKAIYARKTREKGTSRRATLHKWFLDNEILLQYTSQFITLFFWTLRVQLLLSLQVPNYLVPMKVRIFVLARCYSTECKHTEPSSIKINMML